MDIFEFCALKRIKREYSNVRTLQQNRVVERKNKTLIKAARTMLADSFLPNTFWAEAVSTACYVLNRILFTKPQNKTLHELINGKILIISYIRPFGCHVAILNTIDHLGKFEEKSDEGFLVGYYLNSKAFKEDQAFLEELKSLKRQANEADDAAKTLRKTFSKSTEDLLLQAGAARASSTNYVTTANKPVNTTSTLVNTASPSRNIPSLEDIYAVLNDRIFTSASYDDEGAVADFINLESIVNVSPIPQSRIHSIHPTTQIIGDPTSAVQTNSKVNKSSRAHAFIEPKKISQALEDESWVDVMQEELLYVVHTGMYIVPTGRGIVATGRESKARTTLLQSIPDDHVADFHYLDDARDIWNAVKARFGGNVESKKMKKSMLKQEFLEFRICKEEGLHKGYDRMQKILSQLNQLKAKLDVKDINLKFLRALPSSWSQVALTLKTKGELEFLSFDDLYYKLKTLKVDVKGYNTFSSSQSSGSSHSAFVSATSTSKKMSYGDSPNYSSTTTYFVPSNSKTRMDLKWKMAMLSVRVHKFEQKARRKIDFDKKESARFNKKKVRCYKCQQSSRVARECEAKGGNDKQRYSSFKIKKIRKKEEDSKALSTVDTLVDWINHDSESDGIIASKEFGMIVGCDSEDAIKEGAAKLYNLITGANSEEANTAGDAGENELGWDDSTFSVFTTNSEDVEGRPIFHRFAKTDSMKAMPPPLTGDYTSLSNYTDLDESQMSYGTKSSTSCDPKYVPNDFVSCDDSDKSSEINTNDLASSDSSLKSSKHKPTDSTSYASTSGVSTSVNEAEIESNVGTPIKEPITVQDLPIPTGKPKVTPVSTGKPKVKPVPTGKPKVTPVPTGKPQVSTPVPTGMPNRPFPVPTDRGYSPSETPFSATEDEEIFDSGCSRSMTGKQHKASYKAINAVFFLKHKDETYPILKNFINLVENQLNKKVKAIRCDNGTEFKNTYMIELYGSKGIKREYSNPRTSQQNGIAERKNKTLIEAAKTMLADSKLPTMFSTEAVRTACYVLNRVSVTSPHNKTPYALLTGNIPSADEGYIVGYSACNKAYMVYNVPNKRVEKSMNLQFLEEKPTVQGLGHEWYPECVTHKVKIAPHDYSKENFVATFTPQKQLTPEQIFWSQDLIKMKFEALKEQTIVSRPIKALMVEDHVKPKVLALGKYAIDVEPIVPCLRNNREAHFDYLGHLKESVETIRDIVEEAKVVRPRYTKHSQELLEYAIGTCSQDSHQQDKKHAPAPLIRKKQVTFAEKCDKANSTTHKHVAKLHTQKTNAYVPPSTGVNRCTGASGSQPRSTTKKIGSRQLKVSTRCK
nr:ribonuclease H-like domain-containing protein [Tanacetum cinerariifolium]